MIGVDDRKEVVGIEADYARTGKSRDGWRQTFDNLVSQKLDTDTLRCIDLNLAPRGAKTVAIVKCEPRGRPTWLNEELFVRRTASTERLTTKQAWEWWQDRWGATESNGGSR